LAYDANKSSAAAIPTVVDIGTKLQALVATFIASSCPLLSSMGLRRRLFTISLLIAGAVLLLAATSSKEVKPSFIA
jgi:hypothetical protein